MQNENLWSLALRLRVHMDHVPVGVATHMRAYARVILITDLSAYIIYGYICAPVVVGHIYIYDIC